jgi:tetratricopeptide (TPR) repeat protein
MGQCDMAEASFNNILKNKESQSRLPRGSVFYQLGGVYFNMNDFFRAKNNYLLAIASDTAEVGKKRWTTPRAHYNVSICYEILGEIGSAKYHLTQIHEEDNARSYERAQERLNKMMKEIDISMIMAENLRECNNVDQALKSYKDISQKYAQDSDPYIQERLGEVEYRTAEIYFEQKNYNKAISLYEQVIQTRKEKDDRIVYRSYFNLGNCYKMIENYNSARQAYDAAEETDDDRLLARIENARKDLPEE